MVRFLILITALMVNSETAWSCGEVTDYQVKELPSDSQPSAPAQSTSGAGTSEADDAK